MLRYLVILFLVLPFVDLWVLVEISSVIGFWKTLALVLATGVIGAEIVRREISFVLGKIRTSVTIEEVSRNFLEAAMLVFAGLLLISPGVITDILGVIFAFRPFRGRIVVRLARKIKEKGNVEVRTFSFRP